MTSEEAATETVEINYFSEGHWHIKIQGVPVTQAVKRLKELQAAIAQNVPTRPQEARQPSQGASDVSDMPSCPEHGRTRMKASKFPDGGIYCAGKTNGAYCTFAVKVAA